jgi:hypothetical protein
MRARGLLYVAILTGLEYDITSAIDSDTSRGRKNPVHKLVFGEVQRISIHEN